MAASSEVAPPTAATEGTEAPASVVHEVDDDAASTVGAVSPRGARRKQGGGDGPAAKRPRYNDKSFADLTITDLENACREVTSLKRKLDAANKELDRVKDLRSEKAALSKTIKALELEVAKSEKHADSLKDLREEKAALSKQIKELESDAAKTEKQEAVKDMKTHVERIKRSIRQTLSHQMVFFPGLKDTLLGNGREISCFIPNVDPEVLKALGCDSGVSGQSKNKYIEAFLGDFLQRVHNNNKLVTTRTVTVKYIKTACELRVDATYVLAEAKKAPFIGQSKARAKAKGRGKAKAKARASAAEGGDEREDEEEGEEGEGEGGGEGEGEGEEEGEGEGEGEGEEDDDNDDNNKEDEDEGEEEEQPQAQRQETQQEEASTAPAPAPASASQAKADTPKKAPLNID